jgi:hypothetical protein
MKEPCIYQLLMMLRSGGSLVPSTACSKEEVAVAVVEKRFTIDADGYEYVYRPPTKRRDP